MLKEKLGNILKSVAEETAKKAVNDASFWFMYQEKEPESARAMFANMVNKKVGNNN